MPYIYSLGSPIKDSQVAVLEVICGAYILLKSLDLLAYHSCSNARVLDDL